MRRSRQSGGSRIEYASILAGLGPGRSSKHLTPADVCAVAGTAIDSQHKSRKMRQLAEEQGCTLCLNRACACACRPAAALGRK